MTERTVPFDGVARLGMSADIFIINNQGVPDPSRVFAVEFRSGSTSLGVLPPGHAQARIPLIGQTEGLPITIVLNRSEELKRLVPTR